MDRLRDFFIYASYRFLGALAGPMPPWLGYWLARPIGWLLYFLHCRLRKVLRHNIRHVLGPGADRSQVEAVVRRTCVNIIKGHYDLFRLSRLNHDQIKALTRIEGFEHIQQALAQGRGVVVVSAHVGNVDLVGQIPMAYGVPMTAAALHTRPERLFRYVLGLRQSGGLRLIPSDAPMIGLFRALKRGEIVALPCDLNVADSSRKVNFFDEPTELPDGPVRVALRTGAALIPAFVSRLPDDTFLVRVEPPLSLPVTDDEEMAVAAGMEKVVAAMERHIAQHPDQWLVARPIWPMNSPH